MLVSEEEAFSVELSEQERNYIYSCLFSDEIVHNERKSFFTFLKKILAKIS